MAIATSLAFFLLAWSVIGSGMALGLYEALFACLGSLYGEQAGGAITGITLISGFATTLSWPAVALVIEYIGWRSTCLAYGALLVLTVAPLYMWVLPRGSVSLRKDDALYDESLSIDRRVYWLLTTIFALGAVIMTAISVQLIFLLQGQGYSLAGAIAVLPEMRPASLAVSDSSSLMVILVMKWTPPTFTPTKTSALDGRYWTLVEQNTAGAQVNTSLEKSRVKFWDLPRSMKKEMGARGQVFESLRPDHIS